MLVGATDTTGSCSTLTRATGSIIGHERLLWFLPLFGEFWNAIEVYCQKDRLYIYHQGSATLVPGLNGLPFSIWGFIDDTIDKFSSHSPVRLVITRVHHVNHSISMRRSQSILATRRCTGKRWRRCFFQIELVHVLVGYLHGRMIRECWILAA
jgi:hypothetical protein